MVVGILNTNTDKIHLEVVSNQNEDTLKTIIEKHVSIGNSVYSDLWMGYNFLNRLNSGLFIMLLVTVMVYLD